MRDPSRGTRVGPARPARKAGRARVRQPGRRDRRQGVGRRSQGQDRRVPDAQHADARRAHQLARGPLCRQPRALRGIVRARDRQLRGALLCRARAGRPETLARGRGTLRGRHREAPDLLGRLSRTGGCAPRRRQAAAGARCGSSRAEGGCQRILGSSSARAISRAAFAMPVLPLLPTSASRRWRRAMRSSESSLASSIAISDGRRMPSRLASRGDRIDPAPASYWNSLGMILGGSGDLPAASRPFAKRRRRDRSNAQYTYNLGLALARQRKRDEAVGAVSPHARARSRGSLPPVNGSRSCSKWRPGRRESRDDHRRGAWTYQPVVSFAFLNWDDEAVILRNASLDFPGRRAVGVHHHLHGALPASQLAGVGGDQDRVWPRRGARFTSQTWWRMPSACCWSGSSAALVLLYALPRTTGHGARRPRSSRRFCSACTPEGRGRRLGERAALCARARVHAGIASCLPALPARDRIAVADSPRWRSTRPRLRRGLSPSGSPVVLFVLDTWLLEQRPRASLARSWPFAILAIAAAIVESVARAPGLNETPWLFRLQSAAIAPFVYLWHTVAPVALTPLDALPLDPVANRQCSWPQCWH